MNLSPYSPLFDAREKQLDVARRRMWLPATVLAALFLWLFGCGAFLLGTHLLIGRDL